MSQTLPHRQIVTCSRTREKRNAATQTESEICICPLTGPPHISVVAINAEQIKAFQDSFKRLLMALKEDITKESYTQQTQLDSLL